jgi:hypothetical protein
MAQDTEAARAVSRDAIFRITLLSASIVAFSATLLSIDQFDLAGDRSLLGLSWCLFAAVVILGPLSVALGLALGLSSPGGHSSHRTSIVTGGRPRPSG